MNKWSGIGRMTKDPDVRETQSGTKIARFTLAVDRRFKKEGEQTADFISCIAFGKNAEFFEMYFHQGMKVAVVGRIQTGSYTKNDGTKVYTTDVVIEEQEFVEKKEAQTEAPRQAPPVGPAPEFMDIPDDQLDELPFH